MWATAARRVDRIFAPSRWTRRNSNSCTCTFQHEHLGHLPPRLPLHGDGGVLRLATRRRPPTRRQRLEGRQTYHRHDRHYEGFVAEIAPEASRQKGTLQIKVQVQQPDRFLTPELSAKVGFLAAEVVPAKR